MHIKQITISNFRSFKQQAEIQPFSPATNTVVGRNGSGKSNLFDAVQFCLLAPKFAHLRQVSNKSLGFSISPTFTAVGYSLFAHRVANIFGNHRRNVKHFCMKDQALPLSMRLSRSSLTIATIVFNMRTLMKLSYVVPLV